MNTWQELTGNPVLIAPLAGWLIAQVIKTILHTVFNRKFSAERLVGGGGMPSSHSATVCALSTAAFLRYGGGSFEFAVSTIFAVVTMYDAMGVRRETGRQGEVLNDIIEAFTSMGRDLGPEKALKELVGHTPLQVLAGAILGIVTAVIICSMQIFS
ncbi:MAG: divergent PAP2 family protein [Lachnospiraceae bacterium]|nr:divergent PAP2 family protein [Lachnospiraceae bacterium]